MALCGIGVGKCLSQCPSLLVLVPRRLAPHSVCMFHGNTEPCERRGIRRQRVALRTIAVVMNELRVVEWRRLAAHSIEENRVELTESGSRSYLSVGSHEDDIIL